MKANTPEERKKLLAYLARVERHIQSVFGKAYTDAIRMPEIRKAIENGEEFTFKNNVGASKRFKEVVAAFNKSASEVMFTAMKVMQKEGEQTAKDTKAEYAPLSKEQDTAVEHVRDKAKEAHTLQDRRISERVWQCGDNIKHEIEIVVQNGVKEGKSADEISRSVRSYLQQPNNLFKRIRNKETGELELSQAAKDYHPGRGVYRSSYANAMRLARTEMNIAYNTAELNRYANDPTCIGYEVRLSNNHTTKVDGKVKKLTDICDELQGRYPKNFKFVGWHPQCRCCIVPIYISDAEYKDYLKAKYKAEIQGKPFVYHSPNEVKQLPSNFKKWHENNAHRFEGASKPYFLKDNEGIINSKEIVEPQITELSEIENKSVFTMLQEYKADEEVNTLFSDINNTITGEEKWFMNGDLKLSADNKPGINGYTDKEGQIALQTSIHADVLSVLSKIGKNKSNEITRSEAVSIGTFWHEITHNRHNNSKASAYSGGAVSRRFMELANEFVARKTLSEFYSKFGLDKNPYPELETNRSNTSYNEMVRNYDHIIDKLQLDKNKVLTSVKEHLFNDDYSKMHEGLSLALQDGGIKLKNGEKAKLKDVKKLVKAAKDKEYTVYTIDPNTKQYVKLTTEQQIDITLKELGFTD